MRVVTIQIVVLLGFFGLVFGSAVATAEDECPLQLVRVYSTVQPGAYADQWLTEAEAAGVQTERPSVDTFAVQGNSSSSGVSGGSPEGLTRGAQRVLRDPDGSAGQGPGGWDGLSRSIGGGSDLSGSAGDFGGNATGNVGP